MFHIMRIFAPERSVWFLLMFLVVACAWQAQAVTFTLTSPGPPTWTYTLTYAPFDNLNVSVKPTTITVTGLIGVTGATGPTSTDFPAGALDTNNLAWTAQVLNGGTKVVWTNSVAGTGNFPVAKHVIGFTITAAGSFSGNAAVSTSGFSTDGSPTPNLDFNATLIGPASTVNATPAPLPASWILALTGMGAAAAFQARSRFAQMFKR